MSESIYARPDVMAERLREVELLQHLGNVGFPSDAIGFLIKQRSLSPAQIVDNLQSLIASGSVSESSQFADFKRSRPDLFDGYNPDPQFSYLPVSHGSDRRVFGHIYNTPVYYDELPEIYNWLTDYGFSAQDLGRCWISGYNHVQVFAAVLDGLAFGWFDEETVRDDFFAAFPEFYGVDE